MRCLFYILFLVVAVGCGPIKKFRQNSGTVADTGKVSTSDSISQTLTNESNRNIREKIKEYRPGKDSLIWVDGKPIVIQMQGGGLIREIIRESAEQNKAQSQTTEVNKADSGWQKMFEYLESRDKEKGPAMPFYGWIIIGTMGGIILSNYIPKKNNGK